MIRKKFNAFLERLCEYYRHSVPTGGTLEAWFERVQQYPDEYLRWTYNQITETQEMFPRNLPNTMKALYGKWLIDHPEKREFCYCSEPWCDGEGLIHAVKEGEGGTFPVYCFRCATCQQSRMPAFMTTSKELKLAGYKLDCTEETNKRLASQPKVERKGRGNIGQLTESWGEKEWENWNTPQRSQDSQ